MKWPERVKSPCYTRACIGVTWTGKPGQVGLTENFSQEETGSARKKSPIFRSNVENGVYSASRVQMCYMTVTSRERNPKTPVRSSAVTVDRRANVTRSL